MREIQSTADVPFVLDALDDVWSGYESDKFGDLYAWDEKTDEAKQRRDPDQLRRFGGR